jgi:hypothetical protein
MGRSNHFADMNEVHVHTKTACKKQLAICFRHMSGGPNNCRHQPKPRFAEAEGKFIVETRQHMEEQFAALEDQLETLATQISNLCGHNEIGSRNPFTERRTQGHQHLAQAHANRQVSRFKLDTPEFQGCLQPKKFMVTGKNRKFSQKEVPRKMEEKVPREAGIMSQSIMEEEDSFILKYCSVD